MHRRPSDDGRESRLALTPAGQALARSIQDRRLSGIAALTGGLSDAERQTLDHLLDRLLAAPVTDRAYARHVCRFCDHGLCDGPDCPVGCAATALEQQAPRG